MAAEVNKPDFSYQWASGGSIVTPSNVKMQTGWTAEVPPFQWENYLQNRQDNAILHLFQKGISEWDAASNYYFTTSGVRSYVQGSDGIIYVAVQDSVGQNPTTDVSDTYWKVAFADNSTALTTTSGDARYAQRANNLSDLNSISTARVNLGVQNAVEGGLAGFVNLRCSATGLSALVSVSADAVCVKDANNFQKVLNSVSLTTISLAASGVNGLDTGVSAINTWYAVWVIWNGTTTAGLLSTSATNPSMPAGYTHKARVGWVRSDASANKYPLSFSQFGRKVKYEVLAATNLTAFPTVALGTVNPAQLFPLAAFVPTTASAALLVAGSNAGFVGFAPAGGFVSTPGSNYLNPSQLNGFPFAAGWNSAGPVPTCSGEVSTRTSTVLYCSTTVGGILQAMGWEDNL